MGEERSASATTSDKRQLPAAAHQLPAAARQLPAAARQLPAAARQLSATRPRRPTISACLIVKNEEANLGRCLRSLKGKVDEVIVVDTGSTDGTVEIARQGGARVAYFPWCDDFSAARNESLKLAASDFIIWIDADEELIEHKPGALAKLAASLAADVHGCW
ncbi:MAG: glycosyltransferase family 2 protein, partial [Chloroflexota bacterium]|nr:glycosyltransferase family 2 protein [Chloroflexota bacterium]